MNLIIMIFGYIGYQSLGVREFPAIDPPVVTVRTNYTGANAEIVESQITEPLEKAINGIEGIKTMTSASNLGNSSITVEFDLGISLEAAANDVRDKVSQTLRLLPQDIDGPPVVTKADANSDAIIILNLQSDSRNIMELTDYADNVIIPRLQTIAGVSSVSNYSNKRYAMRIWLDPIRLTAMHATANDVRRALDAENIELPSGKIYGSATELIVKTAGRLQTEDDFNNLILTNNGTQTIRLRDVGYAELGPEAQESGLRVDGVQMVAMGISPQPGANYIAIADEFYKRLEQLKQESPSDFKLFVPLDNTAFVRQSVDEVKETLFIALGLVVLVVYFFFRDWVVAFRPLIDIPVSLIGAFFIMYLCGFSLNVLTLLAIVLATGLVVDDGIVVTENIYKKIEGGMDPVEASIKGANEISFAVLSTSITLAVVFLPVIFLEGFVGSLFREFGIVIAGAVLISAFVSLTLTPMLNAKLVRKNHAPGWFYRVTEPFFVALENRYRRSVSGFLRKAWLGFILIVGAGAMIYFLGRTLASELAPYEDRSGLRLSVTATEGSSFDYTDFAMQKLTKFILDSIPEKEAVVTITAPTFTGSGAVNTGFIRIKFTDPSTRKRTQNQIAAYITKNLKGFTEGRVLAIQEQTISVGLSARFGLPVQYVLQAPDFAKLREVLPKFMEEVSKNPSFQGFDSNLKFNRPELNISIDRDKARTLGVNVQDIAQTLQLSLGGTRYGYFPMRGKQYQIIGQFARINRDDPSDLKSIYVKNNKGEMIAMDNLVSFSEEVSPPQLYHYNRFMSATVSAGLAPGKTIGDGIKAMDEIAAKVLDKSVSTALTGPSRDFKESSSNVGFAFILALVLIYLVLAAQFESFVDPFIVMLTVPLALAGAIGSLWFFNLTLNIFSEIGMIMLIGLVTKNGILIVEFANQLREHGRSKNEAIHEAAVARLRPILMTSIATALGALPIALALGAGAQSRIPMGVVIVGGLLFSLIFTLYVVPAMYKLLSRGK